MNRRTLLTAGLTTLIAGLCAAATPIAAPITAAPLDPDAAPDVVEAGGMRFSWVHSDRRLRGRLFAPTFGWLAVGFNDRPRLHGTRFVIAAVSAAGAVVGEERIARPPRHAPTVAFGAPPGLGDLAGRRTGTGTEIAFSLPQLFTGRLAVDLRPGASTHLMLAWSHHAAFDRHSAWRGRVDLTL